MEFANRTEMKRIFAESLGKWIKLKDGSTVLHIENDLPALRVFDPRIKEIRVITVKDFDSIVGFLNTASA